MVSTGSGVYMIVDNVSGRRYVGSAVNLRKRRREHWRGLESGKHHSKFMRRCWAVRPQAFEFKVVLYCSRENLLMYEQLLIDGYRPEFNTAQIAGSQQGYKHTAETRLRMSQSRRKDFSPMKGKSHTEETKRKISASRMGKGGDKGWTQERRDRIGAAHKGRERTAEHRAKISATLTGTSTGRGQLSEDQVREVRRLRANHGWGKCRIAKAMGITPSAAYTVLGNHGYLWVT